MKITNSSGKNRTAIARATLAEGKGRVRINSKPLEIYEPILVRQKIAEPVMIAQDKVAGLDIDVKVRGGGFMGQAAAARTAIARGIHS